MSFDRNVYAEAWRVMRILWPYALLVVLAEYAIAVSDPIAKQYIDAVGDVISGAVAIVSGFFWCLLAYRAHAEVLLPAARKRQFEPTRVLGFTWRIFILYVLAVVLLLAVPSILAGTAVGTLHGMGWVDFGFLSDMERPDMTTVKASVLTIPLVTLVFLLPFFLIGTLLPAYVADNSRGVGRAWRRGKRQFSWMAGRLVLGPGLVGICSTAVFHIPARASGWKGDLVMLYGFDNPMLNTAALAGTLGQVYAAVMLAVLLSRGYIRDRAANSDPTPDENAAVEAPWRTEDGSPNEADLRWNRPGT